MNREQNTKNRSIKLDTHASSKSITLIATSLLSSLSNLQTRRGIRGHWPHVQADFPKQIQ